MKLIILTSTVYDRKAKFHRIHHLLPFIKKEFSDIFYFHTKRNSSFDSISKYGNVTFFSMRSPSKFFLRYQLILLYNLFKIKSPDFVLLEGPYNALAFFIYKILNPKTIFIYDDIDFFPDFEMKIFRKILTYFYEFFCLNFCNKVLCAGDFLKSLRIRQTNKKIVVVENGTNVSYVPSRRKFQLIFIGGMNYWFGLERNFKLVSILKRTFPQIKLLLILRRSGRGKDFLRKKIKEFEIQKNVKIIFDLKNRKLKNRYLSESMFGLALFDKRDLIKYAPTLKAVEYSSAGLPIIATDIGEIGNFVRRNKNGLVFSNLDDIEEISKKITGLVENRDKWDELSKNSFSASKNLDWESLSKKYISFIKH